MLELQELESHTPHPTPTPPSTFIFLFVETPKDLLDEVSETEDIITRNKALERGDKLMTTFWDTLGANTASGTKGGPKNGPSLTATATAVTAVGIITGGAATLNKNSNIVGGGGVANTVTTAENPSHDEWGQEVPGPGGALSPETAETCLQLLADAREAYEGQGFALQADGASRLIKIVFVRFIGE